jgi:hypothetical protein
LASDFNAANYALPYAWQGIENHREYQVGSSIPFGVLTDYGPGPTMSVNTVGVFDSNDWMESDFDESNKPGFLVDVEEEFITSLCRQFLGLSRS